MFTLTGKVQHYAWGGKEFIPQFLSISNTENRPFAEYWMGVHPSAPAVIRLGSHARTGLPELIRSTPHRYLGARVQQAFGDLPFLLKVLDVREMLSIQVHPTKEEARAGFERENREGIPADAPNRNYRDANHKPEMMLALSDFWLLHGFRPEADLASLLETVPEFRELAPVFSSVGYRGLYQLVMEWPQSTVDRVLKPMADRLLPLYDQQQLDKSTPEFWAARAMKTYPDRLDRGIFSIFFFNLVHLKKGEAIFQGAGLPHAYLEGQNIELMSNSDNVLRGGLTPKHVDVPELMKHTLFQAIVPTPMAPEVLPAEKRYHCPVPDFSLSLLELQGEQEYDYISNGPEILLVLEGEGLINGKNAGRGCSFFVPAGERMTASGNLRFVRAFVP